MKILNNNPESKTTMFEINMHELKLLAECVGDRKRLSTDLDVINRCRNIMTELNIAMRGKTSEARHGAGRKHTRIRDVQCPHCQAKTRGQIALLMHIKTVHSDIAWKYEDPEPINSPETL